MAARLAPIPCRPQVLAFLADCKEHPEDDTPRLVLADWLTDHGDERGEFVRLQVRRGEEGPAESRETELLEKHRAAWLGELAKKGNHPRLRRGLVRAGGTPRLLLSKRLASVREYEPAAWVEDLWLYDFAAMDLASLAASPHWACLSGLNIGKNVYYADHLIDPARVGQGSGDWSGLASIPALAGLTRLELDRQDVGTEGARVLAGLPVMSRLRELDLSCNNLGDEGAALLAASRAFPGLDRLQLYQNRMRGPGFAMLARWPALASVRRLDLACNYPGIEGAFALAGSPHLGNVVELRLRGEDYPLPASYGESRLGPAAAAALAGARGLARLQKLWLGTNAVGPEGAEALAASTAFPALDELDLSENAIGDPGAVALAASPGLAGLTLLNLRYNGIGNRGAEALAASPHLGRLTALVLRANRDIGETALAALRDRFGAALDAG